RESTPQTESPVESQTWSDGLDSSKLFSRRKAPSYYRTHPEGWASRVNLQKTGTVLGIKGFFWLSRILRNQYPLKNTAGTTRSVQNMKSRGHTSKFGTST